MTNEMFLAESVIDYIHNANGIDHDSAATLLRFLNENVCKNSPVGLYKCYAPVWTKEEQAEQIYVDICLRPEIWVLNQRYGIHTCGCCCGHGQLDPFIQVISDDTEKMLQLGYKPIPENEGGTGKWCFWPKTILSERMLAARIQKAKRPGVYLNLECHRYG